MESAAQNGTETIFPYRCSCGHTAALSLDGHRARCPACAGSVPTSPEGVLQFFEGRTAQNEYFDKLYDEGKFHALDQHTASRTYESTAHVAQTSVC